MSGTIIRHFSNIETLKDYPHYGVDTDGNVWSFKYNKQKKLSPGWKDKNSPFRFVRLTNRYGRQKNFMVHRLVALAFIPTDDVSKDVVHKNADKGDNRLDNLEWKSNRKVEEFDGYVVDDFIASKIQKVYFASIKKGLPVPDNNTFFNTIIESALDSYIMQYGLRRLMQ